MSSALRYEWHRIASLRATWILTVVSVAVSAVVSVLTVALLNSDLANQITNDPNGAGGFDDPALQTGPTDLMNLTMTDAVSMSVNNFVVWILLATVAAQAFGQEYRHGTIRLTLSLFPKRFDIFFAKIIMCVVVVALAFLACILVSMGIVAAFAENVGAADPAETIAFLARALLFIGGFVLYAMMITAITRILALGVVIPLLLATVVESLAVLILSQWIDGIDKFMPFMAAQRFTNGIDMAANGAVFFGLAAVLTLIAAFLFSRRDA